ncbi:putative bifunctional diguanylate cyclase/phosphodiesterase [Paradevosia shaoguanensis]|uniref:EAL domain-containing protein n=1 Tax=Paradevosia shaoguanensis TaxID=1335043 RepID=A0AA41QIW2_9HYPH|nr:EAL domain-containing protein [Paradevosia shaoguanensis]MCF1740952.1 EAL domain-containing protein [Paradevosia shaoguanensis]MCI0125435.1 EAL domain-containing protein [Paradevosia shaoguanensis]
MTDQRSTRMAIAFRYGSLTISAVGLGWAVVFAAIGWWVVVALDVAIIATGIATYLLIRQGQLAFGLLASQVALMSIAITMGLLLDVPNAEAPRVTHLYLLVIAALGYLNYQRQKSYIQLVLIGVCLLAFVVLASAPVALPFAVHMPEVVRSIGTWANTVIAITMLAGCIYAMQAEFTRQDGFSRDITAALWNNEFHLAYQPQVDLARSVVGAEALLRWTNPHRGTVSPAEFIPHAERAGLMVPIGEWVLEQGCRTLADWAQHPALRELTLAINVSASQLLHDGFEAVVQKALATTGADPRRLTLELTESVLVTDIDLVAAKFDSLHELGITISLDDFGTGYSSLSYLRRLPIQQLKIDRGFVQDAVKTVRSASLVENVVRIGRDLGQTVLAEGVETEGQHALLAGAGCVLFQGYLYGRPMPLSDFERHVEVEKGTPSISSELLAS